AIRDVRRRLGPLWAWSAFQRIAIESLRWRSRDVPAAVLVSGNRGGRSSGAYDGRRRLEPLWAISIEEADQFDFQLACHRGPVLVHDPAGQAVEIDGRPAARHDCARACVNELRCAITPFREHDRRVERCVEVQTVAALVTP